MNAKKPRVLGYVPEHEATSPTGGLPSRRAIPARPTMPSRRMVLRGIGGAMLALPVLESIRPASADGAAPSTPHCAVFLRQANGVTQADYNGESDQYWPHATGPLTDLATQTDRATSELGAWADKLLLVKGTSFVFPGNGCGHSGGGNQVLTAAQVSGYPSGARSLAMGESVDNYIARHFANNGGEPLTLYTGPRNGYIDEVLSYRGPSDLRPAEDDPWTEYLRMIGGQQVDDLLAKRRKSVNDLVRDQMTAILNRKDLSGADRQRLELHFDSIRDFETLACSLSADDQDSMQSLTGLSRSDDYRVQIAELHCDLIALAFACDFVRAATLQIGDGNDETQYTIGGTKLPHYHQISHRIYSDGSDGDPIDGAVTMHNQIDRLHLQIFAHLLEKLDSYGILDTSIAVMTNDLAAGVSHSYTNVPWVIAGAGDGTLKLGKFVDVGGSVAHNQLLNAIISATGLRKDDGSLVDDFGDPSLPKGVLSAMIS